MDRGGTVNDWFGDLSAIIPTVALEDEAHAVPLAKALAAGGLPVLEVTLRTPAGLDAVSRIAAEVPEVVVGVGTVRTANQIAAAVSAGAQFLGSPGCTERLLDAFDDSGVPFTPGVATASEVLSVLERGITHVKFFPAAASGGVDYLRAVAGPFPEVTFFPAGGITPATAVEYLAMPNVGCVGGSWLAPADAMRDGDWDRITGLAREARELIKGM